MIKDSFAFEEREEEEEFDETYLELPELEPRRAGKTNFNSFRGTKTTSPIKPANETAESIADESIKEDILVPERSLNELDYLLKSPPAALSFQNGRIRENNDSKPTVKRSSVADLKQDLPNRSPTNDRKRLNSQISDSNVENRLKRTRPSYTAPKDEPESNYSRNVLDKVNSTLEELHQPEDVQLQQEEPPRVPLEESAIEEPILAEIINKKDLLGYSTPVSNQKLDDHKEKEVKNYRPPCWPFQRWAKLSKIVKSKDITKAEAINSKLLMKELGCSNKYELEQRYDFLLRYNSNRTSPAKDKLHHVSKR
ncbi:hypothetical protein G210_3170 [Candida maltosa Xu316]|uniref:Uncharacterized protein n=1 Tax=Candida maltosa (strain Xu316) TaxID=1245528 RepID=M3HH35_CANMX|nr:hypothetical protein G210_3170 [Candida maltosa Xu316]